MRDRTKHFIALGIFLLLSILWTWPLVLKMGDSVVGQIGDNVYFVWLFGWFRKALFELHTSPFVVPNLNYPEGWSLAHTEMSPATIALGFPASLIAGPIFGYNFIVLVTFILSAYFMYLWVEKLSGNTWAAILAGFLFAFSPYRVAHFRAGHLNLLGTMWLPLFFMGLSDLFVEKRRSRSTPWLTGISLGLIGLSSIYYLFATLLVVSFVTPVVMIFFDRGLFKSRVFWGKVLLTLLISLPLLIAAGLPFVLLESGGGLSSRDVFGVTSGSASLSDFFLPSTDHFILGSWVGDHFSRNHWMEGTLYIGVVCFALALVAVAGFRKDRDRRKLIALLLVTSFFATLFALGTHLYWNEQIVELPIPSFLEENLGRQSIHVRLPVFYLFQYIPLFSRLRTFKRFAVLLLLCCSCLAGLGAHWISLRLTHKKWSLLAMGLLLLFIFDFYPGPFDRFAKIEARPVDSWLAGQPGDDAVAQFPFYQVEDQDQVYNTLVHEKPFIGGFFNAFPPNQYLKIRPVMEQFPDEESISLLGKLGFHYIVIDTKAYDIDVLFQELDELGLAFAAQFDDDVVFTLGSGTDEGDP